MMNAAARERLEEVCNARWEQRCSELEEFIFKHGHPPTRAFSLTHRKLITWLREQQKAAASGRLRADRWWRLTAVGLELLTVEERWDRRYMQLVEYRRRFGHCRVPAKWGENRPFGHWVDVQRQFKRKGLLRADRIARLEAIGFEWVLRFPAAPKGPSLNAHWDEMLGHLERFRQEHGHTEVPPSYREVPGLGLWVGGQRSLAKNGKLRPDRRERLEAIGFAWEGTQRMFRERWDARFQQLLEFRQRFGHCRVPHKWKEAVAFSDWVHVQRAFKKKGKLSEDRIQRLEAIGFEWSGKRGPSFLHGDGWTRMLAHLVEYQRQHGDTQVPPSFKPHGLGSWVGNQREAWRKGSLGPDRREQLDAMGFEWRGVRKADAQRWERRFAQLVAYRQQHGHCRVPSRWREDPAFGHWVDNQRVIKRAGKLSPERVRRLDEIGFHWCQ